MGQSKRNLRCEKLGLVLWEHAHLDQMAEQLTTLHKLHEEVDAELVLEDILHVHQEWVVDLSQNVFFELDVLHLFVFEYYVLSDALHGVELVGLGVLDQEHLTERALADHLSDLEIFKRGGLRLVPGKDGRSAAGHGLTNLHAVLISRL